MTSIDLGHSALSQVEKAAIAISAKTWAVGCGDNSDCSEWDEMSDRVKDIYREAAKVAIDAISDPNTYYIGPLTFQNVFQRAQLHNMADMQAVMDAVEAALKNILDTA